MNLVAATDFRNTAPERIEIEDAAHELHVHKGARFSIGGPAPFEKLNANDKALVVQLNSAGRIVDADSQKDKVAKIDAEVEAVAKAAKKKEVVADKAGGKDK